MDNFDCVRGSGIYLPGLWSPGSPSDLRAMAEAAFHCSVFLLRRRGERLSAADVMAQQPPSGGLLCVDRYNSARWHVSLYQLPDMTRLLELHAAALVRDSNGSRLYSGEEWDVSVRHHWRQTWLCSPTAEAALEILRAGHG